MQVVFKDTKGHLDKEFAVTGDDFAEFSKEPLVLSVAGDPHATSSY